MMVEWMRTEADMTRNDIQRSEAISIDRSFVVLAIYLDNLLQASCPLSKLHQYLRPDYIADRLPLRDDRDYLVTIT